MADPKWMRKGFFLYQKREGSDPTLYAFEPLDAVTEPKVEMMWNDLLRDANEAATLAARVEELEAENADFRVAASNVIFDHDAGGPCTPESCADVCAFRDLRAMVPNYEEYRERLNSDEFDIADRPRPSRALQGVESKDRAGEEDRASDQGVERG